MPANSRECIYDRGFNVGIVAMSPWLMGYHRTVNYAHTQIILQLPYLFLGGIGGIFQHEQSKRRTVQN